MTDTPPIHVFAKWQVRPGQLDAVLGLLSRSLPVRYLRALSQLEDGQTSVAAEHLTA